MAKAAAAPRISPAAMMTRGALMAYLTPRLAMDQRPNTMKIVNRATQGVTSANFRKLAPQVANALRRSVQGRLAQDGGIDDLAQLLSALAPEAAQADQAPGLGQIASNPGGSAGPMTAGATGSPDNGPAGGGGESSDIIAKIKAYLEQEGVAPEILNNLDAFLAEHQPAGPAPPAPGGPPPPPAAGPGGPGGPGGPDQGIGGGGDAGGLQGLGGGAIGGMSTGGMGPGGGLDIGAGALDQEGTEGLVEGGNNGGAWADLDPRGGTENELKPESAEDANMDNLPEAFRDDDETEDEAEDALVPGEQDEQTEGVPEVSSKGTKSHLVGGRGGEDRAITKAAMDKAIRMAQDAAIKTQRDIRQAERFVRPWVGDMAMDEARGPADVYRAALKALGVRGIDKVHPDALRPILEAQPHPSARTMRDQQRLAADSAPGKAAGSFLERFPDAAKIVIQ